MILELIGSKTANALNDTVESIRLLRVLLLFKALSSHGVVNRFTPSCQLDFLPYP